jgi:hypothetical protein
VGCPFCPTDPRSFFSFFILGLFLFTDHCSLSHFQRHGQLWKTTRKGSSRSCRQRWRCRRRACGLSFLLPLMPGYRRSHFLSLHFPLLTFGCVNWSSCCSYYAYLYYSIFCVPDVKENFVHFLRPWIHFFVLHSSNTFLKSYLLSLSSL